MFMLKKLLVSAAILLGAISLHAQDRGRERNYEDDRRYQNDRRDNDRRNNDRRNNTRGDSRYDDWANDRNGPNERYRYECRPMHFDDFYAFKKSVEKQSFDSKKLELAKTVVNMNCLTAEQIFTITTIFSFESNRLEFAKVAYRRCADPINYFRVLDAFTFSSSKSELMKIMERR